MDVVCSLPFFQRLLLIMTSIIDKNNAQRSKGPSNEIKHPGLMQVMQQGSQG